MVLLNNLNKIENTDLKKKKGQNYGKLNDEINKKIREQIATQKEIKSILAGQWYDKCCYGIN